MMKSVYDFAKICRTCLQEGEMINLDINCDTNTCLLEKLMHCTLIKIDPTDGLPTQICSECLDNINSAYRFALKCEKNDKFLRQIRAEIDKLKSLQTINTTETENDNDKSLMTVKIEPDISESDDNFINFDSGIYTDHTYDKNSCDTIIKSKTIEKMKHLQDDTGTNDAKKTKSKHTYVCKKCDKSFFIYHDLKLHHKAFHTGKGTTRKKCHVCSKTVSYGHLKYHMKIHTADMSYCCEFCGKRFILSSNLNRHIRLHSEDRPFKCNLCDKSFVHNSGLADHRRVHTGEKRYQCNVCGHRYTQLSNFKSHLKKHTTDDKNGEIELGKPKIRKPRTSEYVNVTCEICNQQFTTTAALKTHQQTHKEKKYQCENCFRGFADVERLKTHYKTHFGDRPFSCIVCQKSFTNKANLNSHMNIHSGHKSFQCEVCNKSFSQVGHLKYHMRVHSGEKPFSCKYCGKTFALNGNLTVHLRLHTKETPYQCDFCDKKFHDSKTLKKHRKVHLNDCKKDISE